MRIRRTWGAVVALAVLVLSGCAQGVAADSSTTGGAIEVAVTKTCTEDASADCVEINGEKVLVTDDAFRRVDLEAVSAADDQSGNAVDVELTQDGAAVLAASTTAASEAGEDARLVIRAGGEVVAAVKVIEPISDDHVVIALPSDVTVQEFADQTRRS
jgi:hypothetical protein